MKKRITSIFFLSAFVFILLTNIVISDKSTPLNSISVNLNGNTANATAVIKPGDWHQTLAYCTSWEIKRACTQEYTALSCSSYYCLV